LTRLFRAPGRVNLIGEHTDYNDGFVMPAAINFWTSVEAKRRSDRIVRLQSQAFPTPVEFTLDDPSPQPCGQWWDYVRGVALQLEAAGHKLQGADLRIASTVPIGAGLSSSAALEVSTGFALARLAGHELPPLTLAKIAQAAENKFVGMHCGIMDQFTSTHGVEGHAILLDCRSLQYRPVPLPDAIRLVICNTMVKHELNGSQYNERRADCEEAARILGIASLRDATLAHLADQPLPARILMRAEHVISEIERTERAADALLCHNLSRFGELMYESHASLRDHYEVSCPELDLLVDLARRLPGVHGARMTGGGFGGCTINLVAAESVAAFTSTIRTAYHQSTGIEPDIYTCQAVQGVEEVLPF
jgi:galactokinase